MPRTVATGAFLLDGNPAVSCESSERLPRRSDAADPERCLASWIGFYILLGVATPPRRASSTRPHLETRGIPAHANAGTRSDGCTVQHDQRIVEISLSSGSATSDMLGNRSVSAAPADLGHVEEVHNRLLLLILDVLIPLKAAFAAGHPKNAPKARGSAVVLSHKAQLSEAWHRAPSS